MLQAPTLRAPRRNAGFSLLEVLVALFVMTEVILGVLVLLDSTDRLARSQTYVAEMQQSTRIGHAELLHMTRMAGRGSLPLGPMPQGFAISVRNNVAVGSTIAPTNTSTPNVVEGTDVLTLRGVFDTPLYWVDYRDAATLTIDTSDPSQIYGRLRVHRTPQDDAPVANDLTALLDHKDNNRRVALVLVAARSEEIYAVVEFDPANSDLASDPALVAFKVTGGTYTDAYLALSGGAFPTNLDRVVLFGILEEHRFYVRQEFEIPGLSTSREAPRLSHAKVYPGTDVVLDNADNWQLDVADNVFDLQVALGMDLDDNGQLTETGDETDEWLFNAERDDPTEARWIGGLAPNFETHLFYVRFSMLTTTDRAEQAYRSPTVDRVEDHVYSPAFNTEPATRFRRQLRQTLVDLRNVE